MINGFRGQRYVQIRRKERILKFIAKIKKTINWKNNKKLSRIEALLENETIRSKYTRDELVAGLEFHDAFERERKCRRREDRRRLVVKCIGGFLAFICINGSFIILANMSGIIELLFDEWKLWPTLAGFLLVALWAGYAILLVKTFFWLSDKTGFYFWIEDWIEAWNTWDAQRSHYILKFKEFPRRERRALVRDLEKELDVISYKLLDLEEETRNDNDEELSDSLESVEQLFISLSSVSSSLLQHRASWKAFVLTLEETFNDLELELADIVKYHEKVQSPLKQASQITAKSLFRIIDSGNRKEAKKRQRQNSGI